MKKPREVISQLSPQDALAVLKTLADSDVNLATKKLRAFQKVV